MRERTFSIIKPDAVKAKQAGEILARIEKAGFDLVALRERHLTRAEAEGFYHVHKARPFFGSLCDFMSSGPCITMVLERENAIAHLREIMGATDPAKARRGHHPQGLRRLDRSQLHPRLGRAGDRGLRDRLLLRGDRALAERRAPWAARS